MFYPKKPKSQFFKNAKTGAKFFIYFEIAAFVGSYALWRRMNTSQDFRHYMHQNFPSLLEGYYKVGETLSGEDLMRKADRETWQKQ